MSLERRKVAPFELSRRAFLTLSALALVSCSGRDEEPRDSNRLTSSNEVVRGLGRLEKNCNRELFAGAMTFFAIPATPDEISDARSWQSDHLVQLRQADLQPTVVLEPGEGLTFNDMHSWSLDSYFGAMKRQGVTDDLWGRVVIAPDFIGGRWQGNTPENYEPSVRHVTEMFYRHFPKAEATVLIDTALSEIRALLPLLEQSSEKLVTTGIKSVGIQAFANAAEVPFDKDGNADVSGFLSVEIIERIAKAAGVQNIWINTGLTKEDAHLGVTYSAEQREATAHAIGDVIEEAMQVGITVNGLVVFAENKLETEGRDFSFPAGHEWALITLAERVNALNIPLAGFTVE